LIQDAIYNNVDMKAVTNCSLKGNQIPGLFRRNIACTETEEYTAAQNSSYHYLEFGI